jgi:MFS family permease
MLGPAASGLLAGALGLRAPFAAVAVVCALAVLAIALFNRASPSPAGAPAHTPATLSRTLRENARRLAAPGLGHYLMQMVRAGPPVVLPLYGAQVLGLGVEQIGLLFSISSFIDMLLFYPTGLIMDRAGRKWAIVPSALIMGLGLALVPFTRSFEGLLAAAVVNGFGNGLGAGVMITIGADLAPARGRGEFLGMWGLIGDAGISSGPVLVGALADLLSLSPAAWAIALSGLGAGAVFALFVPETLKRDSLETASP